MTDKRIYVVVPHEVELLSGRKFRLCCGMLAAQAVHAARKMQDKLKLKYEDTTTIILGARDQNELWHVMGLLHNNKLKYESFEDGNEDFYGSAEKVLTAVAVQPVDPAQVDGILDYLPRYSCGCEAKL